MTGGNAALDRFVRERVGGPPSERLLARYAEAVTSSQSGSEQRAADRNEQAAASESQAAAEREGDAETNREQVRGRRLRATAEGDHAEAKDSSSQTDEKPVPRLNDLRRFGWIITAAAALLAIGLWRRWGNPSA